MSFTNEFAHEMYDICNRVEELKANIEMYYLSENPHTEKMKIFNEAPNYLKNHEYFIVHYDLEVIDERMNDSWLDKGAVVELVEVINTLHKDLETDSQNPVYEKEFNFTEEDVLKFEEWVLEQNLGSYRFDW